MIVVYSAAKGTEKDLSNWGFIRCPPAVAAQRFIQRKGSSLSVVTGVNDYDMNFLVGNDLGNAVYCQWLRHTLSEEQWNRVFDNPQSVNEERAGDAVEVCLATLYFTTLFPVEFRFWGDPFENYAGLEHSIRSFAVSAGCIPTSGSQRSPPGAPLSSEVLNMGQKFATVLGSPAVTITLEEYYALLKKMKDGPVESGPIVREEPEDAEGTDASPEPGIVESALYEGEGEVLGDDAATSPQDEIGADDQDDAEAPPTPISTKKRRIGASLQELMTQADNLKVCPVCWVEHPDFTCPRAGESQALYTALSRLLEGGAAVQASLPTEATSTAGVNVTEPGDVDMDVDNQKDDIGDSQDQPTAAESEDVTDIEVDKSENMEIRDEPPTILPEAKPRTKARPIRKLATNKMSGDESSAAKSAPFLDLEGDVSPLGKPRSRNQWTFRMSSSSRIRSHSFWSMHHLGRSIQDTSSTLRAR